MLMMCVILTITIMKPKTEVTKMEQPNTIKDNKGNEFIIYPQVVIPGVLSRWEQTEFLTITESETTTTEEVTE